jgi:endonuclease YncB( thermonuclease family)
MRCWRYSRNWANNRHITRSFVAALCLFFPASAWSDDGLRIVTGDKLRLGGATYCLFGIDAPDPGQQCRRANGRTFDCARVAALALMDLTAGAKVSCQPNGAPREDCTMAICRAGGFDLSANMVHTGWALNDSRQTGRYTQLQTRAKKRKHGLWAGTFEKPWDWREATKR